MIREEIDTTERRSSRSTPAPIALHLDAVFNVKYLGLIGLLRRVAIPSSSSGIVKDFLHHSHGDIVAVDVEIEMIGREREVSDGLGQPILLS